MSQVLDASALLAYLHQEPGWEEVRAVIGTSCIGAVNWSEVAQKAVQKGLDAETTRNLLTEVGLTIVPFSAGQAEIAAQLWAKTRGRGLSLADRACLALAIERGDPAVTADRTWGERGLSIEIRQVR